jgi:hypothetical protein
MVDATVATIKSDNEAALLDEEDKKFSIEEAPEEESSNEFESASEEEVDNNSNE